MAKQRNIEKLQASIRETIRPAASLGFIGLATDRASFLDFSDFILPFDGVAAHATRIPFVDEATPESLADLAPSNLHDRALSLPFRTQIAALNGFSWVLAVCLTPGQMNVRPAPGSSKLG